MELIRRLPQRVLERALPQSYLILEKQYSGQTIPSGAFNQRAYQEHIRTFLDIADDWIEIGDNFIPDLPYERIKGDLIIFNRGGNIRRPELKEKDWEKIRGVKFDLPINYERLTLEHFLQTINEKKTDPRRLTEALLTFGEENQYSLYFNQGLIPVQISRTR